MRPIIIERGADKTLDERAQVSNFLPIVKPNSRDIESMNYVKIFRGTDQGVEADANAFLKEVADKNHRVVQTYARVGEEGARVSFSTMTSRADTKK